jgi:hypothetical protein
VKLRSDHSRPRMGADLLTSVAGRITERDRYLCRVLAEHRVLTTHQIVDLAFNSLSAAEQRLITLYRLRLIDRFRPLRPQGSAPFHYMLDELGAILVAAERGLDVAELGYRRDKTLAVAYSQRLAHLVGVNGFFTALVAAARRTTGRAELLRWWSERRCATTWGHIVRPDGYGRWSEGGHTIDFFLEYDRGTEPLTRLAAKLNNYADLAAATTITTTWTLFWLPTPSRETALRDLLTPTPIPVATAHPAPGHNAADPIWLPTGHTTRRHLATLNTTANDSKNIEPNKKPHP